MAQFIPMAIAKIGAGAAAAGGAAKAALIGTAAKGTTAATAGLLGKAGAFSLGQTALTASLAGSGLSALSSYRAGQAAEMQAKQSAQMEGIRAREESIGRRERLIQALAQQSARVGSAGITMAGSPGQVMLQDISEYEREEQAQTALSKMRQEQYRLGGKEAAKAGKVQAGVSLLQMGAQAAKLGK